MRASFVIRIQDLPSHRRHQPVAPGGGFSRSDSRNLWPIAGGTGVCKASCRNISSGVANSSNCSLRLSVLPTSCWSSFELNLFSCFIISLPLNREIVNR